MIEGLERYAGCENSAEARLMKANKPSKSMDAIRRAACDSKKSDMSILAAVNKIRPAGLDRLKKIHSEGELLLSTLIKQCGVLLEVI